MVLDNFNHDAAENTHDFDEPYNFADYYNSSEDEGIKVDAAEIEEYLSPESMEIIEKINTVFVKHSVGKVSLLSIDNADGYDDVECFIDVDGAVVATRDAIREILEDKTNFDAMYNSSISIVSGGKGISINITCYGDDGCITVSFDDSDPSGKNILWINQQLQGWLIDKPAE